MNDISPKTYLLTGGTGFLGSLLSLELLAKGHTVIFLGRGKSDVNFEQRVRNILISIKSDIDLTNAVFVEADLQKDDLVLSLEDFENIDAIWHLAANLSFKNEEREEVLDANLSGLRKMLDLTSFLKCPIYYLSSANVHGNRSGIILEDELLRPEKFNNPYEESKFEAEKIIHRYKTERDIEFIIFRPSILIDTKIRNLDYSFFGYYTILYSLLQLKNLLGYFSNIFVTPFFYYKGSNLNLMPVDTAIDWMMKISASPTALNKTFHITNPYPFSIKKVAKESFEAVGLMVFLFRAPKAIVKLYFMSFTVLGFLSKKMKRISESFLDYCHYIIGDEQYDITNTKEILSEKEIKSLSFSEEFIGDLARRFIKRIKDKKDF